MLPEYVQNYFYNELTNTWIKGASDSDGNQAVIIVPPSNPNKIQFAEDLDFIAAEDGTIFNLNALLGKNGNEFLFINDGVGDIEVSYSSDGAVFTTPFRTECGDKFGDSAGDIHSVKIGHTGTDSAYRITGK